MKRGLKPLLASPRAFSSAVRTQAPMKRGLKQKVLEVCSIKNTKSEPRPR